jgi:hypothetical protein
MTSELNTVRKGTPQIGGKEEIKKWMREMY